MQTELQILIGNAMFFWIR